MTETWPDERAIGLDGVRLWGPIYQGACPPVGQHLAKAGFGALVLCSTELMQVRSESDWPDIHLHLCGLIDERRPVSENEWLQIEAASAFVQRAVNGDLNLGKAVPTMIACQQGKNRSALVAAASLIRLTGWSGLMAVNHIKRLSSRTFSNEVFEASVVRRWPAGC